MWWFTHRHFLHRFNQEKGHDSRGSFGHYHRDREGYGSSRPGYDREHYRGERSDPRGDHRTHHYRQDHHSNYGNRPPDDDDRWEETACCYNCVNRFHILRNIGIEKLNIFPLPGTEITVTVTWKGSGSLTITMTVVLPKSLVHRTRDRGLEWAPFHRWWIHTSITDPGSRHLVVTGPT